MRWMYLKRSKRKYTGIKTWKYLNLKNFFKSDRNIGM